MKKKKITIRNWDKWETQWYVCNNVSNNLATNHTQNENLITNHKWNWIEHNNLNILLQKCEEIKWML